MNTCSPSENVLRYLDSVSSSSSKATIADEDGATRPLSVRAAPDRDRYRKRFRSNDADPNTTERYPAPSVASDEDDIEMSNIIPSIMNISKEEVTSTAYMRKENSVIDDPLDRRSMDFNNSRDALVTINEPNINLMTPSTNLIFDKKKKLILLLARALLKYGCPCHRMDDSLQLSAKMLSLNATFTFLSDSILISISSKDTDEPYTMMVKAANGFDNGKIVRVNRIMNQFHKDKCTLDTCLETLQEITRDPPTVSAWQMIVAFGALGFSASIIMFQGSWIDGALSAVLGSIVGALAVLAGNITIYGRVFEVSACIIVGFTARAMNDYACFTSVAIPSILVLLPGYGMTMAMMELSSHHIPTGTIRLVYAIIYTLMLGYGLQMGSSLYGSINSSGADDGLCNRSVNPWFYIPLFPMMSISIGVSFGSSPKEWPSQIFCAASGFCVTYFLGKVVPDSQIVGSIAAFATALYANLALKVTGEPPLSPLCVGVTFLVPGSIGVRGVYALLHQEDLAQAIFALRMIMIAMGLSVGIFAASMIIYPSGKTKSLYISF